MGVTPLSQATELDPGQPDTVVDHAQAAAAATAKALTAKTPARLAQLIAQDPQNIEAYVATAHKNQGNSFVQAALAIVSHATPSAAGEASADVPSHDADIDARSQTLANKWGARPHRFGGAVDGSNAAEVLFRDTVPQAIAFINERAHARGHKFQISSAELTTNFIAEGGFKLLDQDITGGIHGFDDLGIDTFMDRIDSLRPWLHPSVERSRVISEESTNEKHQPVHSIKLLTIVQAVYASAAMLALTKSMLERDARAAGTPLGDSEQFYLETVYFNTGPKAGKDLIDTEGAAGAHRRWNHPDDPERYHRDTQYNATWRTSTYELMKTSTLDHDRFRPSDAETAAAGNADLGAQIKATETSLANLDHSIAMIQNQLAAVQAKSAEPDEIARVRDNLDVHLKVRESRVEMLAEMIRIYKPPG